MSEKLKPCPFCGGEAEVERDGTNRQSCIVMCTECGTTVESNEIGHGHHWNRRAPQREPQAGASADVEALVEQVAAVIQTAVRFEAWPGLSEDERRPWLDMARAIVKKVAALPQDDDRAILQVIDERDHRENQVTEIARALGVTEEWSNLHDLGDLALEAARELNGEDDGGVQWTEHAESNPDHDASPERTDPESAPTGHTGEGT